MIKIKTISALNFFTFMLCMASDAIPLSSYKPVGGFDDKQIVTDDTKKREPLNKDDTVVPAHEVSEKISANMVEYTYLVFESLGISDKVLSALSETILRRLEDDGVQSVVVNLKDNIITTNSVDVLIKLLENKKIKFINIVDNYKISRKNMRDICSSFYSIFSEHHDFKGKSDDIIKEHIRKLTAKLIFIRKEYIGSASRRVLVYKDLVDKGYLEKNWAEIHKNYYRSMVNAQDEEFDYLLLLSDSDSIDRAIHLK